MVEKTSEEVKAHKCNPLKTPADLPGLGCSEVDWSLLPKCVSELEWTQFWDEQFKEIKDGLA